MLSVQKITTNSQKRDSVTALLRLMFVERYCTEGANRHRLNKYNLFAFKHISLLWQLKFMYYINGTTVSLLTSQISHQYIVDLT